MNYFHLYKQAAPKNIINKYKVQDPFLKLLITKFEKDINQRQIDEYVKQGNTGEQAFDQFVIDNLLSNIIDNLDLNKEDSPYFLTKEQTREILEDQARRGANFANPLQQQQAEQGIRYFRQNPEQYTAFVMQKINESKAKCFKEWIDYLSETELYQENPAFSYMILRSIANKTEGRTDDPLPLNSEALPQVFEKMKDGKDLDIFETYKHFGNQADVKSFSIQKVDGENGWIKIPSKINDPENFQENVKKLVSLSTGNGWCTASVMAEPYLSRGDFWMYIENGRAAVAVRFDGNSVEEIQGRNNQRPYAYWNVIEKLFDDNNFDKNSGHYKELLEVKRNNEKMESDPNFKEQFIELCKNDFKNLHKIDEKYIDDDMIQKLSPAIMDKIRSHVVFIHQLPRKMQNNQEIRSVQKSLYLELITEDPHWYKKAIESFPNDKDIYELGKEGYLHLVEHNQNNYPIAIELFPNDKDIYEAGKQSYLRAVKRNPNYWYGRAKELFPNDKEELYEAYKQGYVQLVEKDAQYYHVAIQEFPNDREFFANALQKYRVNKLHGYPLADFKQDEDFFENPVYNNARRQGFLNVFADITLVSKRRKDLFDCIIKSRKLYPNDDEIYNASKKSALNILEPPNYNFADPAILHVFPNDDDIFEKFMKLWESYLTTQPDLDKRKTGYINAFARDLHLFPISRQSDLFTGIQEILDKLTNQKPKQACGWYTKVKYSHF